MERVTIFRRIIPLALLLAVALTHDAYDCQDSRKAAASGPHNVRAPLIIGDSTMIFAAPYLGRRGLEADAKGCRQFGEGVAMLAARRRHHNLPDVAILALGANGPIAQATMARALRVMGKHRVL